MEEECKDKVLMAALAGLMHNVMEVDLAGLRVPTGGDDWTKIITLAGKLASGGHEPSSPPERLNSIFSHLEGQNIASCMPVARLNPQNKQNLFPKPASKPASQKSIQGDYQKLWNEFIKASKSAELTAITDPEMYLESFLEVMQRYTWCMPSSSGEDVSLYNQARVRAALCACLAADKFTEEITGPLLGNETPVGLLVWGDLSGLQKFIYTLASEGAAKCLRARSFYVQLLGEALATGILHKLGLPVTNLIYVGGGGFQLLAHHAAEKDLVEAREELGERFLAVHGGELGLTVEWEKVTVSDFGDFGQVYDRLGKKLNREKRRPFAKTSSRILFEHLSQPLTQGGDPLRYCVISGEDGKNLVQFEKNSNRYKSTFVDSLEELGNTLPKAGYFVLKRVEPEKPARAIKWDQALSVFGMKVHIIEKDRNAPAIKPLSGEFLRVWRLKPVTEDLNKETLQFELLDAAKVVSYRPFAQLTPMIKDEDSDKERPKTFDELARKPVQKDCALERWGVLRMDVDNLGNMFSKGFGSNVSLARIASLSFALRLFFEGYLPELAKGKKTGEITNQDLQEHLYIQYSGGDDLFVVGAWDALPEFARRIQAEFSEYASGNPAVTISGGMELFSEKYPLYLAAQETGESEHAAKDLPDKNAFCFLGEPFHWKEFEMVRQLAYKLAGFVKSNRVPHSLIQTMLMLHTQQKEAIRKNKLTRLLYGRWTWLAAYQFSRVLKSLDERKPELQETRREIEKLRDQYTAPNAELRLNALAARWAQFLTRGG